MKARNIRTIHFGEITVEPHHVFYFTDGMLGFGDLHEYVLISEESTTPFKWLISLDAPEIGFPLLSPWHVDLFFEPGFNYDMNSQVLFVVVTLEDENGDMSANMKAPVILNVESQSGKQVILPGERFSTGYVIGNRKKASAAKANG